MGCWNDRHGVCRAIAAGRYVCTTMENACRETWDHNNLTTQVRCAPSSTRQRPCGHSGWAHVHLAPILPYDPLPHLAATVVGHIYILLPSSLMIPFPTLLAHLHIVSLHVPRRNPYSEKCPGLAPPFVLPRQEECVAKFRAIPVLTDPPYE